MAQHVRRGLTKTDAVLLHHTDDLREAIKAFLVGPCGAKRAKPAGDYRRRVEVIEELVFVVEDVITPMQRYGQTDVPDFITGGDAFPHTPAVQSARSEGPCAPRARTCGRS